ncbi:hypothetical protein R6Q59_026887 [Mikania micrantha]
MGRLHRPLLLLVIFLLAFLSVISVIEGRRMRLTKSDGSIGVDDQKFLLALGLIHAILGIPFAFPGWLAGLPLGLLGGLPGGLGGFAGGLAALPGRGLGGVSEESGFARLPGHDYDGFSGLGGFAGRRLGRIPVGFGGFPGGLGGAWGGPGGFDGGLAQGYYAGKAKVKRRN